MMLFPHKKKRKGDELALDKMMEEAEYEEYEKIYFYSIHFSYNSISWFYARK